MKKSLFNITGMTCSACSARVHKAVAALDGVADVSVNLLKNNMTVRYDPDVLSAREIIDGVEKAGYGAAEAGRTAEQKTPEDVFAAQERDLKSRLAVSVLLTLALMYFSMGAMFGLPVPAGFDMSSNAAVFAVTQLLLSVPVVFVNFNYFKTGFKTLLHGAPNMDSLIALGSGAAMVFSVFGLYRILFLLGAGDPAGAHRFASNLYFESAVMILTLITLGRFFEIRAKGKTAGTIAGLMSLAPKTATVMQNGVETVVDIDRLAAGDIIVVKAGEKIPADGVIIEGRGVLDESALTGESLPVEKKAGDTVMTAGVNMAGHFLMRADKVGQETTLAQIIRLVDEATSSKAPIARMADRISGVFVPVVIAIAVIAAAVWLICGAGIEFALSIGIAVLVISCPCALGLATPTAIMVGTGRGAARGVLFKSAAALETAGRVDTVALDKTGTLTVGKPHVTGIIAVDGVSQDEVLTASVSLEKMSEHALGAAIIERAAQDGIVPQPVEEFNQIPGQGISGKINGVFCLVGNAKMLREAGIDNTLEQVGEEWAAKARTPLYCAAGKKLLGVIGISDPVRPDGRAAVAAFQSMGLEVVLLTGDNAKTAEAVRSETGVDRVISDMLPQDKEKEIRRLQQQGKKVAMIGDGINDAPALARADIGIAVGTGTDIAIDSAGVVLMKNDLASAVFALRLGRAVLRNIKENLFWAFFYNCIGIPVAAGVLWPAWGIVLSPVIAAAAMSFSSVSVVTNALRLRRFSDKPLVLKRSSSMNKSIMIEGMKCEHCANFVKKALLAVDGVENVAVDLAAKKADVQTNKDVSDKSLSDAITDAGFQTVEIKDV